MKHLLLEKVTGITLVILSLVLIVICAVMFLPGFSEQLKTVVVTAVLGALGAVTGYWLNSSADAAKKNEPAPAPSTTTTTTTTLESKEKP